MGLGSVYHSFACCKKRAIGLIKCIFSLNRIIIRLKFAFNYSQFPLFSLKQTNGKQALPINILKALSFAFLLTVSTVANAIPLPGYYIGGQFGWGDARNVAIPQSHMVVGLNDTFGLNSYTMTSFSSEDHGSGMAGRAYLGYQFNCHWAAEAGYTLFKNVGNYATAMGVSNDDGAYTATGRQTTKTSAVDLMAKGVLPIDSNFSVYAKLGGAYVMQRNRTSAISVNVPGVVGGFPSSTNVNKLFLAYGAGVGYDFFPSLGGTLEWDRIQKNKHENIGNIDFAAVGITYYFGI